MAKRINKLLLFAGVFLCGTALGQGKLPVQYVDPMIGTAGTGHTFPGATTPFGLVQASPETGFSGWDYCSGYRYEDHRIYGFSHTHLSGTGALDLGDILLTPYTGREAAENMSSIFSHANETAQAGYYAVSLPDFHARAELTATGRAAIYRFAFQGPGPGHLMINLKSGLTNKPGEQETHVINSGLKFESSTLITGYTITKGWAGTKHVYFALRLQQPVTSHRWVSDSTLQRNQIITVNFRNRAGQTQMVKIGLSTVSIDNARDNLTAEIPGWDFDLTRKQAANTWSKYLSKIKIEGTEKQKQIFYTALYHALIAPNNLADKNGQYRGVDNRVYSIAGAEYYSTLSLWDTYRALNPLYTIILPQKTNAIIRSMIAHFNVQGFLPIWTLWGHENYCMIANHAIPVIVDAYQKGIRDYDVQKAYQAVKISSIVNHKKSDWLTYDKYGYLPSDIIRKEAVSTTLENGFDDWCTAAMAKSLNQTADYQRFIKRSAYYKNLFDPSTNLMRGKDSSGKWVTPFDPLKISHAGSSGGDYTEGNAWQYTWQVQQDIPGLIRLFGGRKQFTAKLDSLFAMSSKVYGDGMTVDVTGLIGQYVHGNEPCHHVAYLYTLAGEPWKTQQRVDDVTARFYDNKPDGLSGNDDCGQMSAWYIFSALGFYPVNPASGQYVFGKPRFSKAVIMIGKKKFTITAEHLKPKNLYVQAIRLNGKPYHKNYINHAAIVAGGQLTFVMGPEHP